MIKPVADLPVTDDLLMGDWRVQPSLNRVRRNGTTLHLRPQLMDVLVCLARGAGRTIHHDEFVREVWGGQACVSDSALARCIAELRQMLGDRARSPLLIETIPKRGYRLIPTVTLVEHQPPPMPHQTEQAAAVPSRAGSGPSWLMRARHLVQHLAHPFSTR
jgi:DNA-binding winged helix-turn-helix (wHTH) protein